MAVVVTKGHRSPITALRYALATLFPPADRSGTTLAVLAPRAWVARSRRKDSSSRWAAAAALGLEHRPVATSQPPTVSMLLLSA